MDGRLKFIECKIFESEIINQLMFRNKHICLFSIQQLNKDTNFAALHRGTAMTLEALPDWIENTHLSLLAMQ